MWVDIGKLNIIQIYIYWAFSCDWSPLPAAFHSDLNTSPTFENIALFCRKPNTQAKIAIQIKGILRFI
jgi:hypothetical protein